MNYSDKLKDPRWQKKRLEIFERDNWECKWCKDKNETLNVHHLKYEKGKEPWDYDNQYLITLCEYCHGIESDYRRETEEELLKTLSLNKFSQYELQLLDSYISDCPDELKKTIQENEFKHITEDEWMANGNI